MEMTMEMVVATRAEILARVICPESAEVDAREVLEQAERLAQAVGSDRRRAIVWLRQILSHEPVTNPVLLALGFDRWFVEAADTVGMRQRENVQDHAKRLAACHDPDVIAVAVAAFDERIHAGVEEQEGTLAAYKEGRGVLERAAAALARRPPDSANGASAARVDPRARGAAGVSPNWRRIRIGRSPVRRGSDGAVSTS